MGKSKTVTFLIIMGFFLLNSSIFGQDKGIQFENLNVRDGLSSDSVSHILQDKYGFLWFSTKNGLNRYDGHSFKIFQQNPEDSNSLSVNMIQCMYLDDRNILWIGTNGGGLDRYNISENTFSNYHNDPEDENSLSNNLIIAICKDKEGNIWAGSSNGLNKLDRETGRIERFFFEEGKKDSLPNNVVRSLFVDRSGTMWVGTYKGLSKYNPAENTFFTYGYEEDNENSLSANAVMSIIGDTNGTLWLGTWALGDEPGGLVHFDPAAETFKRYVVDKTDPFSLGDERIYSIYRDKAGEIWVGTWGGGLFRFNKTRESFTSYRKDESNLLSLSEDIIYSIFEDSSGIMWFGTNGGGINKYNRRKEQFSQLKHQPNNPFSLPVHNILTILEDDRETLWFGSNNGGLVKYDKQTRLYKQFTNIPDKPGSISNNVIQDIEKDSEDTLYIGTNHGLNILKKGSSTFEVLNHEPGNSKSISHDIVYRLFYDSKGYLWIGYYYAGLTRYNRAKNSFKHFTIDSPRNQDISDNNVLSIYEDSRGTIWCGTNNGLNRYKDHTFKKYFHLPEDRTSLSSNMILSIFEDSYQNLWIGTDRGLNLYDEKKDSFKRITAADELKSRAITSIMQDAEEILWLSTKKGVIRYNPKTDDITLYTLDDGLLDNEIITGYKTKSGRIYFGSSKGLTTFLPHSIKDSLFSPPILITSFKKFNKEVTFPKQVWDLNEISISWQDNFITFDFVSLDYSAPSKNRYAFKLDGFDKEWIYADTQQSATYTNLDGGKYRFMIKATNSDGMWFDNGKGILLKVAPKPWKSWWAYSLYFLLFAGLLFGLYLYFKTRLQLQTMEKLKLEEKVNERTIELKNMNDTLLLRNKEMLTSLNYSRNLQSSILPSHKELARILDDFFIYWNPREVVGGDFYWFHKTHDNNYFIGLADCTGHGVPGALMTMTANAELNHITKDICSDNPAVILQNLNSLTRIALNQDNPDAASSDEGLDIALLYYMPSKKKLLFSGARLSLYYCEKGEVFTIKGDTQSIGYVNSKEDYQYHNHEINLEGIEAFYLSSDGFIDQLGGSNGLPLGQNRFKEFIRENHQKTFSKQKTELEKILKEYRGSGHDQIDDITVMGFKF